MKTPDSLARQLDKVAEELNLPVGDVPPPEDVNRYTVTVEDPRHLWVDRLDPGVER